MNGSWDNQSNPDIGWVDEFFLEIHLWTLTNVHSFDLQQFWHFFEKLETLLLSYFLDIDSIFKVHFVVS